MYTSGAKAIGKHSHVKIGAFSMYFLAFATWALNQAGYIVNVFMGIDGNSFSFAYVLTFVLIIACATLSLVSLKNFNKAK